MATAQDVADRAREILNDPAKVRWSDAAFCKWLSDALDLLARFSPGLFTKRGTHTTTAGALQTITNARAISVVRVVGLTEFDKPALDAYAPTWQAGTAGSAAQWAAGDNQKSFYVYPPSAGAVTLSIDFVEAPAELTALSDSLPVSDDFVGPLADFVIGMSESKDAVHVSSGRAQVFMQSFASKLGIRSPVAAKE